MGFIKIKSFCTLKKVQLSEEEAHRMGDNLGQITSDRVLISRIYKELNNKDLKNGPDTCTREFSKEGKIVKKCLLSPVNTET